MSSDSLWCHCYVLWLKKNGQNSTRIWICLSWEVQSHMHEVHTYMVGWWNALSGSARSVRVCGFKAYAENWVVDPFLAERNLLLLRLHSATAYVRIHVRFVLKPIFLKLLPFPAIHPHPHAHPPFDPHIEGILPKGPYPPCLCMADRALLAGYPRHV